MPVIQYAPTALIEQIEVPIHKPQKKGDKSDPVELKRSAPGALHVRPRRTTTVTNDELEILKDRKIPFRLISAKAPDKKPVAATGGKPPEGAQDGASGPAGAAGGSSQGDSPGDGQDGQDGGQDGGKGGRRGGRGK